MRFLVDAQLPPQLARTLAQLGHDAVHLIDLLAPDASDGAVVRLAAEQARVIISKDADFLVLSANVHPPVPFLWVRLGNIDNARLIARIIAALPMLIKALEGGAAVVELR